MSNSCNLYFMATQPPKGSLESLHDMLVRWKFMKEEDVQVEQEIVRTKQKLDQLNVRRAQLADSLGSLEHVVKTFFREEDE